MPEQQTPNASQPITPMYRIAQFIATGMYSGYSPFAPGTAGSAVGLLLYFIPGFERTPVILIATVVTFFIGTAAAAVLEKRLGEDPPVVVIDEVVGMWVSLLFLPKRIIIGVLAFFFFRIYDIVKPPPARQSEKLPHGWGIMIDDVFAAIYANLSVQVLEYFFKW